MNTNVTERKICVKDFLEICRTCFGKRNTNKLDKYIELIKIIPDYEIDCNDELPSQICDDCVNKLKDIDIFITTIKNNELYLRDILNRSKTELFDDEYNYLKDFEQNDSSEDSVSEKIDTEPKVIDVDCEFSIQDDIKSEVKNETIKCNQCDKVFTKHSYLRLHSRSHSKEDPYECKICFKKFRYRPNLKRHENVVHKGLKPFECETCGKKFATLLRKTEHIRIHTGERPFHCTVCGLSFKKYSTFYAHDQRHKIKSGLITKSETKSKPYNKKPSDISQHKCETCDKILSSKQALFVHKKVHTGEKSFLCTECGRSFVRKSHLEVHFRIHTGEKPYKCEHCGKNFRQLAVYKNHLLIHKNKRSFICEICQKSFIQLGHLQNHVKTHTGEKPYHCSFCNKGFTQNGNLRAHMRTHTNERPYRCSECHLGFYDSSSLKKHSKTHTVVAKIEIL